MIDALWALESNRTNVTAELYDKITGSLCFDELLNVYEEQNGVCALTSIPLLAPKRPPTAPTTSTLHHIGFRPADNAHGFDLVGVGFAYFQFRVRHVRKKKTSEIQLAVLETIAKGVRGFKIPLDIAAGIAGDVLNIEINCRAGRNVMVSCCTLWVYTDRVVLEIAGESRASYSLTDAEWSKKAIAAIRWCIFHKVHDYTLPQKVAVDTAVFSVAGAPPPPWL